MRHPSTDVWCMAWAIEEEEPHLWTPDKLCFRPDNEGKLVYAHNAPFELAVWANIMVPRYGWPPLELEQTFCTMAMCYAMGLPGSLDDAASALGLAHRKDREGHALMLRMSRPRRVEPDGTPVWWDDADKLARLYEYCRQDVRVEREIAKRLLPLSERERAVWLLDYKINQRGVAVDLPSARAAITTAEAVKEDCGAQLAEVTGGAVTSVSAVAALKEWCGTRGVHLDSLAKQTVIDTLAGELPGEVHAALTLRQEAGKASVAKFDVMVRHAGEDGRVHNLYQYHGANTGRWAGRNLQTHNLVRDMPPAETVETVLQLVREGRHDAVDAIYGPPLTMLSRCLRSFFVAPEGKMLVSGDWSNVEGRGQAWFAGEQWKLDAFRAADERRGPGLYELAYARMFSVPVETIANPSWERQVGKTAELAFGYGGGVGSFHVMGKTYGVKVPDAQADEFKLAWRAAHPRIVQTWYALQRAAIAAVENPGQAYTAGHPGREATFKKVGSFLWCRLPSSRVMCYPYPKVLEGQFGPQLTYMTVPAPDDRKKQKVIHDPANTARWVRIGTYGGALFNNVVQGAARDLLAECMLDLNAQGGELVLHTHDDLNIEVPAERAEEARVRMQAAMRRVPRWATGLPLHADCKVMRRYGK